MVGPGLDAHDPDPTTRQDQGDEQMAEYQGSFDDAQVTLIEPGDPIPADFRAKLEAAQDEALTAVVELLTHYGEGDAHATGSRALRDWTRPQLVNAAMWALISLARERHPELKP